MFKNRQVHLEEKISKHGIKNNTEVLFKPNSKTANKTSEKVLEDSTTTTAATRKVVKGILDLEKVTFWPIHKK